MAQTRLQELTVLIRDLLIKTDNSLDDNFYDSNTNDEIIINTGKILLSNMKQLEIYLVEREELLLQEMKILTEQHT